MLRTCLISVGLLGVLSAAVGAIAGCQPASETTREKGTIDSAGFALMHATAGGENHHWNIDVTLHAVPVGTYVLIFSTREQLAQQPLVIDANDPAVRCAAAHGKSCTTLGSSAEIVSYAQIGPGGVGVLRSAFDVGAGGWFSVVRVDGGASTSSTSAAGTFDVQLVSEALSKDEEPHRFTLDVVR